MIHRYSNRDGIDDLGSLVLPFAWRRDARQTQSRSHAARPWHHEELHVPLESVGIDSGRVLYWDNDPTRENSLKRVAYMMACRAVPLVVRGGNSMRNVVDALENGDTRDLVGYGYSRIALARRVIAQLQTDPGQRAGNYRSANLTVVFRYAPPHGEAFELLAGRLREAEGL